LVQIQQVGYRSELFDLSSSQLSYFGIVTYYEQFVSNTKSFLHSSLWLLTKSEQLDIDFEQ